MARSRKNMIHRAKLVQDMTAEHYEPGRHDRCKKWVFLHIVSKVYPMSERTFFRYLAMDISDLEEPSQRQEDKRQLKLF
jgi:hypothetical protein